jgi:hypothetical protein
MSPDAVVRAQQNWDYNLGLLAQRLDAGAPPNYVLGSMLEDLFLSAGLTTADMEAFLKDWEYTNVGGDVFRSDFGTAYIGGRGITPDSGFGFGAGGGGVNVSGTSGTGNSIFGGGGFNFSDARPTAFNAGLFAWRITA